MINHKRLNYFLEYYKINNTMKCGEFMVKKIPDWVYDWIRIQTFHPLKDYLLYVDGRKRITLSPNETYLRRIDFVKLEEKYVADLNINEDYDQNDLHIYFYSNGNSQQFINYVIGILTTPAFQFLKTKRNILLKDYRGEILKINSLIIENCIINEEMIEFIKKYFVNLKNISFINCKILNDSKLSDINCKLSLFSCTLENINSLNFFKNDLEIVDCKFDKITNAIINSKSMDLSSDDKTLEEIFLKCNFPDLENIRLSTSDKCFNKCLIFLPYACPKVIKLSINGFVYSYDFLYHFTSLDSCKIKSVNDSIGIYPIFNPYVVDEKERNSIIMRSNRKIQSEFDIHLALNDKLLNIINAIKLVGYSKEERDLLLNNKDYDTILNPLEYCKDGDVSKYYQFDSNNNVLKLQLDSDDNKDIIIFNSKAFMFRKNLNICHSFSLRKQFVLSSPFIYHPNGIPIFFKKEDKYEDYINVALSTTQYYNMDKSHDISEDVFQNLKSPKDLGIDLFKKDYYYLSSFDKKGNFIGYVSLEDVNNLDNINYKDLLNDSSYIILARDTFETGSNNIICIYTKSDIEKINDNFVRIIFSDEVIDGKHIVVSTYEELEEMVALILNTLKQELKKQDNNDIDKILIKKFIKQD